MRRLLILILLLNFFLFLIAVVHEWTQYSSSLRASFIRHTTVTQSATPEQVGAEYRQKIREQLLRKHITVGSPEWSLVIQSWQFPYLEIWRFSPCLRSSHVRTSQKIIQNSSCLSWASRCTGEGQFREVCPWQVQTCSSQWENARHHHRCFTDS